MQALEYQNHLEDIKSLLGSVAKSNAATANEEMEMKIREERERTRER